MTIIFKINPEDYKKFKEKEAKKEKIYREDEMVIEVSDNEDWVDPKYNHGHPKLRKSKK